MTSKIDIKKALQRIQIKGKEVSDFHPHLWEFLGRLPNVVSVEHTHGPNEQGADFILTMEEDMEGVCYVGVVVKNDGISAKSVQEVSRQIFQCRVLKPVKNGEQLVNLNKVWVIANGSITNNAKQNINAEYNFGVTYIDQDKLADMMYKYEYKISGNISANIELCLNKQRLLADQLRKQNIGYGTYSNEKFIEQKVMKVIPFQYPKGKRINKKRIIRKKITIENASGADNVIIVYGEPGSGKSNMLCKALEYYASEDQYNSTKAIPIYTTGKDILNKFDGEITKLIDDFRKTHEIEEVEHIIIIDGLDECKDTRSERLELLKKWKNEAFPKMAHKMIFSSRDNYIEEKNLSAAVYEIASLSTREVIRIIKERLKDINVVDKIISDVSRSDMLKSLPGTPLATIILINLLKDPHGRNELPANLPELFAKYSECSLGRWDTNVDEGIKQRRYEATSEILGRIGDYMLENDLIQINEQEARKHFANYLNNRNLGIKSDDLFNYVVKRSDLISLDNRIFKFRHRTINEFFAAKLFSDRKIDDLGDKIFEMKTATILYFYVGAKKDCSDLIQKISDICPQSESTMMMKFINMSNILLASYLTEYNYIEDAIQKLFMDLSTHLEKVFNKEKTDSIFSQLSIMEILWMMKIISGVEYGRPFFKAAIENNLIEIEGIKNVSSASKSMALFFLNVACREVGCDDIFSDMIKKMGNNIPDYVGLAIKHESDFMEAFNMNVDDGVKKYKKSIKRRVSKSVKEIDSLYNKRILDLPKIVSKYD